MLYEMRTVDRASDWLIVYSANANGEIKEKETPSNWQSVLIAMTKLHASYKKKKSKQIRALIDLKFCSSLTIRLLVRDFYNAILDKDAARVNYHA